MEKVIFDTNAYRDFAKGKNPEQIEKAIQRLKAKENKNNIETLISPIVAKELLAHLADSDDPSFNECLMANKALYLHSGSVDSYKMVASTELLISHSFFKKTIPSKVETNRAIGQMSYHLAANPNKYVFKRLQRNLNLNRDHVLDSENSFALAMKDFVRKCDPSATGWKIFEHDEPNRKKVLAEIRSEKTSFEIAFGYLFIVDMLLLASGQVLQTNDQELYKMGEAFIKVFPEPIALYKYVMESLVNSEFNLMEQNRSNFVWDVHLMFNVGNHSVNGDKLNFVTSDKAMIRAAIKENAKYSIYTFDEYLEYLG